MPVVTTPEAVLLAEGIAENGTAAIFSPVNEPVGPEVVPFDHVNVVG